MVVVLGPALVVDVLSCVGVSDLAGDIELDKSFVDAAVDDCRVDVEATQLGII